MGSSLSEDLGMFPMNRNKFYLHDPWPYFIDLFLAKQTCWFHSLWNAVFFQVLSLLPGESKIKTNPDRWAALKRQSATNQE